MLALPALPTHAKAHRESFSRSGFGQETFFNIIKVADTQLINSLLENKVTNQIQEKHMVWKLNRCLSYHRKQQIPTEAPPGSKTP